MSSFPPPTRQIPIVCPGHSRPIAELHYSASPQETLLLSACHDRLPMLRDGDTGNWIGTLEGHKGAVWSAQLNHDATVAATGSADFNVRIYDAITGKLLCCMEHGHIVRSVAFTPSGRKLVTVGQEKLLRVFDISLLTAEDKKREVSGIGLGGNAERVMALPESARKVVAVTETMIVTGHTDGRVCVWDLTKEQQVHTFTIDPAMSTGVMDMESSRGNTILTVAAGTKVAFFSIVDDFQLRSTFSMPFSFKEEGGASLHPTANRFIAGGSDTYVRVFDYETGEVLECLKGHHGPIRCLRYSPSGKLFATGSEDGTIRIWQTNIPEKEGEPEE